MEKNYSNLYKFSGDIIEIDIEKKSLRIIVQDEELSRRRSNWVRPNKPSHGSLVAYRNEVSDAEQGALWLYQNK